MDYRIRELCEKEYYVLNDFLYEAIFIPEGEDMPSKSIIQSPELQVYTADFGKRKGDMALVAEVNDKIVGAVWVRIMNDYGHIDNNTPSFAISLYKEYRNFGIGTVMMKKMLELLKQEGYKQVSLSVQKANYAFNMYKNLGFKIVDENDEEYMMVCNLENEVLLFVVPSLEMKDKALDYKNEHLKNGESKLHGAALLDNMEYEEWLRFIKDNSDEKTVHSNWVTASTFFVVRESDNRIIGMVDIRHYLNDFLRSYGGNIGYGVRPSERKKGYATMILKKALYFSKSIGLKHVMLACYKDNEASRKTILKCNGVLEKEFIYEDGKIVQVYWINITE